MEPWNTPAVTRLVELALQEDLSGGDVTTRATIGPGVRARAKLVARQDLVVAGLPLAEIVFSRIDPVVRFDGRVRDGDHVVGGSVMAEVIGPATGILAAERTALNFLQRLCGVATQVSRFVAAAGLGGARIADTRKTTPGYRALEKYAVRRGGGINHRTDLGSGILIKDNHVVVAGSVAEAVRRARAAAPPGLKVEIEVDTLQQLKDVLDVGTDVVMLDNFTLADTHTAVALVRKVAPQTLIEASGGVTLETVGALARSGVDFISVGALTHSAPAADIALDLEIDASGP